MELTKNQLWGAEKEENTIFTIDNLFCKYQTQGFWPQSLTG